MRLKTQIFICLAASLFVVFSSCRKGDEDPEISLRSRKARIEGDWTLKSGHLGITYYDSKGNLLSDDYSFDGKTATIYVTPTSKNIVIYNMAYLLNLYIHKDGKFEIEEQAGNDFLVAGGTWNFTGRVGESKNKEGVLFVIDNLGSGSTNEHLFNKFGTEFSLMITELRNKEMKLKVGMKTYLDSQGHSTTFSGSYTFVQ